MKQRFVPVLIFLACFAAAPAAAADTGAGVGVVNINTADADQLQLLPRALSNDRRDRRGQGDRRQLVRTARALPRDQWRDNLDREGQPAAFEEAGRQD